MIGWRLILTDGVVDGTDRAGWAVAPANGVVAVVCWTGTDRHGRRLGSYAMGGDWYWWTDDGVRAGESANVPGVWIDYDGPADERADAKRGAWVDDDAFNAASRLMRQYLGNA